MKPPTARCAPKASIARPIGSAPSGIRPKPIANSEVARPRMSLRASICTSVCASVIATPWNSPAHTRKTSAGASASDCVNSTSEPT